MFVFTREANDFMLAGVPNMAINRLYAESALSWRTPYRGT